MKDMLLLLFGDLPCWYELSWSKKEPAIILRVHRDFIESTEPIRQDSPFVLGFIEEFGFSGFSGDLAGDFGFEDIFKFKSRKGDFIDHVIEIPVVEKQIDESCEYCDGSGKDKNIGYKCLWCYGSGKNREINWKIAYVISASFSVFFDHALFPKERTSFFLPQLMTVQTATIQKSHGGSLYGTFGPLFSKYLVSLEKYDESALKEITEAMISAHKKMNGRLDPYNEHSFRAYIHDRGRITLDCPGDACGVYVPPEEFWHGNRGREFSCHNTDTPFQQLTLLAGLAALHDKARREMKV